jgi:hypothetical protein
VGPAVVIALLTGAPAAGAATITVANTNDSGPGSLRAAVATVNAGSGGDTIMIPSGTYVLMSGELALTEPVTITGAGSGSTTISGDNDSRIFDFQNTGPNSVSGVTLTAGKATFGGAITGGPGTLTLTSIAASLNTATSFGGGAVQFGGGGSSTDKLTITGSSFSDNTSVQFGGGAVETGGGGGSHDTVTINSSSFTGNIAMSSTGFGAALETGGGGSSGDILTITASTFANNIATASGGAIDASGGSGNTDTIAVTNTTIANNTTSGASAGAGGALLGAASTTLSSDTIDGNSATGASGLGGGIDAHATATVVNTIIAGNAAHAGANCAAPLTSQGHNIESANTCGFSATGDQVNTDPRLGPLQNNGGPEQTQALLAGSPAINAANSADCPLTDERGLTRTPGACDIGAYQFAPPTVTTGGATSISQTTATVGGAVTPNLRDASYRFEIGTSTTYTFTTSAADAGAGSSSVPVTGQLTGLKPGTTYHYALIATNGDGASSGADRTFTTPPTPAISGLRVKPKSFATRRSHRHHKLGTTVTFQLNTPASLSFRIQIGRPGRLGGHDHCSAPNRSNLHHRRCTHWVRLSGTLTIAGQAEANSFQFNGRLKGKPLKPGSYRLVAAPVAGGIAGTGASVLFRIVQ